MFGKENVVLFNELEPLKFIALNVPRAFATSVVVPVKLLKFNALLDLSAQFVTGFVPVTVRVSAASIHKEHPGIVLGSNPKYCWVENIVYISRRVLAALGETTNVIALDGAILTGLVRVNVFVKVTLK